MNDTCKICKVCSKPTKTPKRLFRDTLCSNCCRFYKKNFPCLYESGAGKNDLPATTRKADVKRKKHKSPTAKKQERKHAPSNRRSKKQQTVTTKKTKTKKQTRRTHAK